MASATAQVMTVSSVKKQSSRNRGKFFFRRFFYTRRQQLFRQFFQFCFTGGTGRKKRCNR